MIANLFSFFILKKSSDEQNILERPEAELGTNF